jgi:hypothetical protein
MTAEQKGPRGFSAREAEPAGAAPTAMRFGAFVLSLASGALVHLGRVRDPEKPADEPPRPDFPLAQQTIDILEMLEEKTRGNLDAEEQKLLTSVLHDLRMAFVEVRSQTRG